MVWVWEYLEGCSSDKPAMAGFAHGKGRLQPGREARGS
jgi:hypothetical protein